MRHGKDPNQRRTGKMSRRIKKLILMIFCIIIAINLLDWHTEGKGSWRPDYPKTDLEEIVSQSQLSQKDYHTILMQTGLGKDAVDMLRSQNYGSLRVKLFEEYQNDFFSNGKYECRVAAVIVHEERLRDKTGKPVQGFKIADLRNGDILITKSTHSLGWRHGHAAIVTDASKGETMEAILLGKPVLLQNAAKWRTYPSFIQLRLKNSNGVLREKIAEYAKKKMLGVPYGLLTGIPAKAPDKIKKTQCSHLIWYPYMHFGYDLDSDGSWLVTPKDIANSDLLEVVQVYGADPEDVWP